jgi:hypothetical protein
MDRIFSYAFTTAGRRGEYDGEYGDGPYAVQDVRSGDTSINGGAAAGNVFCEITGKGLQTGIGTIAGLGYGLPMSRLYAKCVVF